MRLIAIEMYEFTTSQNVLVLLNCMRTTYARHIEFPILIQTFAVVVWLKLWPQPSVPPNCVRINTACRRTTKSARDQVNLNGGIHPQLPEKMALRTEGGHRRYTLLFAFIMLFNISLSTSVSLDLTELRNKVSKIKVHPRGNLWATGIFCIAILKLRLNTFPSIIPCLLPGHFMGKKSISNSQLQDSPLIPKLHRNTMGESEDLRELLKVALQAQLEHPKGTRDIYKQVIRAIYRIGQQNVQD